MTSDQFENTAFAQLCQEAKSHNIRGVVVTTVEELGSSLEELTANLSLLARCRLTLRILAEVKKRAPV